MNTEKPIWFIAEHLCEIPNISLLTPSMEKNLTRLDRRSMRGERSAIERNSLRAVVEALRRRAALAKIRHGGFCF